MRTRAFLFAIPILLAGCGGNNHDGEGIACAAVFAYIPNSRFVGHYTAAFTPKDSTVATTTLTLDIDAAGVVTGTDETGGGAVSGTAGDIVNGCDTSRAGIEITLTSSSGGTSFLTASKKRDGEIAGSLSATQSAAATLNGTLTLTATPLPG